MKKILIAIDDSPACEKIAAAGYELAKQLNAEIALVSVVDSDYYITDGIVTPIEMAEILRNDLKKNQELITDMVFKGYKTWTFLKEGKPSETILKIADEWEADLIVLGTHGRTGISHLLIGSVAEKVIRHSTKPLLIIPNR